MPTAFSATRRSWRERTMVSIRKISTVCILCVAACTFSAAQTLAQALQPAPASGSIVVIDPLGRNTPSNSVLGFLKAATSGDYNIAAQYLQMSAARRQSEGEQTATKLKYVLDNAFVGNYSRFNQPHATPQQSAPLNHQKLGPMSPPALE